MVRPWYACPGLCGPAGLPMPSGAGWHCYRCPSWPRIENRVLSGERPGCASSKKPRRSCGRPTSASGRGAYLHGRGLNEETLRVWWIGFQPQEGRRDPAECWGFPAQTASGQRAWVRIPRGIVLRWLLDGQLWQLKVRTNRENPKYLAISGGHPCLFWADTLVPGEPAILAEGKFDAMLLWQEVGDLIGVATLGSCNRGLSVRACATCWAVHGCWWPMA